MNGVPGHGREGDGRAALVVAPPPRFRNTKGATEIALYTVIVCAMLFGGAPMDAHWRLLLISMTSAILLPLALISGGWSEFGRLSLLARCAVIGIALLPALQLIPLPPDIWASLPGRELPRTIFSLVGTEDRWHPLSLTPRNTQVALLCLLAPMAAFFAALTLDERGRTRCVALFLGLAAMTILVGLIQLGSRGAVLDFYGSGHRGHLLGFFANRNHQGLLIAIAAAFALAMVQMRLRNRQVVMAWSAILSLTFIVAAVGTISRAGLGLTIASLVVMNLILWRKGLSHKHLALLLVGAILVAAALYLLSLSHVVDRAIARFSTVKEDGRWEIWQLSAPLATQYFPWGSGLGSFVPAYAAIEPLNSVTPSYLNHAHNDYLELFIEAGLPGLVVFALFAAALAARIASLLTGAGRLGAFGGPAALAILLVALHSIVDYPLRTQALVVPFGVCLAFFLSGAPARKRSRAASAADHEA